MPRHPPAVVGAAPMRPRERRTNRREHLAVVGLLSAPNTPDKPLEVAVLNVSRNGCAFGSPVPFRAGAVYRLRIGSGSLHLGSTLRIISSRERSDGSFEIGAKFV